jgi:hypothetical protein
LEEADRIHKLLLAEVWQLPKWHNPPLCSARIPDILISGWGGH